MMITVSFEKIYNKPRLGEPCSVAVPAPKGTLTSPEKVRLYDQDRQPIPVQVKTTAYWEDHSIRWMYLTFLADLPANRETVYYCDWSDTTEGTREQEATLTTPIIVERRQETGEIFVETGELSFVLGEGSDWLKTLQYGSRTQKSEIIRGPFLRELSGERYQIYQDEWKILEQGPIRVVLEGKGHFRETAGTPSLEKLETVMTITVYAGKPWIDMGILLTNMGEGKLRIDSYTMEYHPYSKGEGRSGQVRTCAAASNYRTQFLTDENGGYVEKRIDGEYLKYEANEHFPETFYGTLFADHTDDLGGLTATVYQAQQNYPKAVSAQSDGLTISLVPERMEAVVMWPGMAREQKVLFAFHPQDTTLEDINFVSTVYQMPDRPLLKPEIFQAAGVFENVFVTNQNQNAELALTAKADTKSRCYGMMNWGDAPDGGYTMQGRGDGEPVWTNNEYDYPHACALMYARTGVRRFLDYLLVSAKHQMDVDICHYSQDPLILHGQYEHSNSHCASRVVVCSHQWVEGLIDYYHFTGEHRALESAIGIGENVLRLLNSPALQKPGGANARETGWALRTLTALYQETGEEHWLGKCEWIVGHFEEWKKEYGLWLSPYLDHTSIRVVFMISIAVCSLMRYYRVRPSERIKNMMLEAVDDLLENARLENGLFYYKELPSLKRNCNNTIILEALSYAFELTGDKKYLEAGIKTFEVSMSVNQLGGMVAEKKIVGDAVIVTGPGPKGFAQSFLPLVTYYRLAAQEGLLTI
jgi:hypothetical protein